MTVAVRNQRFVLDQEYQRKNSEYFATERLDLVACFPNQAGRVLEVGCGIGKTGAYLKREGLANEVVGIELIPEIAEQARGRLDTVLCGDVEQLQIPYPAGYFKVILCGDVLEHLKDPWNLLRRLKPYLQSNGLIIAAVPNVRHWRTVVALLVQGRWDYVDSGILDRTHLRFFTGKTSRHLFESNGYRIVQVRPQLAIRALLINRLTFGLFTDLLAYRYVVIATPA